MRKIYYEEIEEISDFCSSLEEEEFEEFTISSWGYIYSDSRILSKSKVYILYQEIEYEVSEEIFKSYKRKRFIFSKKEDAIKARDRLNSFIKKIDDTVIFKNQNSSLKLNPLNNIYAKLTLLNKEKVLFPVGRISRNTNKFEIETADAEEFKRVYSRQISLKQTIDKLEFVRSFNASVIPVIDLDKEKMLLYDENLNEVSSEFDWIGFIGRNGSFDYYLAKDGSQLKMYKKNFNYKKIDIWPEFKERFFHIKPNFEYESLVTIDSDSEGFDLTAQIEKETGLSIEQIESALDKILEKKILTQIKRSTLGQKNKKKVL